MDDGSAATVDSSDVPAVPQGLKHSFEVVPHFAGPFTRHLGLLCASQLDSALFGVVIVVECNRPVVGKVIAGTVTFDGAVGVLVPVESTFFAQMFEAAPCPVVASFADHCEHVPCLAGKHHYCCCCSKCIGDQQGSEGQ